MKNPLFRLLLVCVFINSSADSIKACKIHFISSVNQRVLEKVLVEDCGWGGLTFLVFFFLGFFFMNTLLNVLLKGMLEKFFIGLVLSIMFSSLY